MQQLYRLLQKLEIPGSMPDELFTRVTGYSRYLVSSYGRIYDLQTSSFKIYHMSYPRQNGKPYYKIRLIDDNGKAFDMKVSRFVLMGFFPIENPSQYEAHHINENTLDNRVCNLQWVTHLENCREHYYRNYGGIENYPYTDEALHKICQMLQESKSYDEISMAVFGRPVDLKIASYIKCIRKGIFRTDISSQYEIPIKARNTALFSDNQLRAFYKQLQQNSSPSQVADLTKGVIWDENQYSRDQVIHLLRKLKSGKRFERIISELS